MIISIRIMIIIITATTTSTIDHPPCSTYYEERTTVCIISDSLLAFRLNLVALGIADDDDDDDDDDEDSGREGDLVEDRDDDDDDDDNQGDEGDGEPIDEDSPPEGPGSSACPPAVQLLLDIVDRCCHFLPLSSDRDDGGDDGGGGGDRDDGGDASVQVIIIDTLSACFMRLCSYSSHFLPCVHRVWPSLVARLVEMRATLLSHLLLSVAIEEERGDHHHHHNNDRPLHHQISDPGGASIEIAAPLAQMMMHASTDSNIKQQLPHHHHHHPPHHPHHQHQHLPVLLPLLLDLMSILSITASSFMTSRFKDDLLPEILIALCAFQQQYVHTYHHSLRSKSTSYNHSKHSLVTKIKTALLRMLLQLTKTHQAGRINPMQSTLEPIASTLVWFIVPCIAEHEVGR